MIPPAHTLFKQPINGSIVIRAPGLPCAAEARFRSLRANKNVRPALHCTSPSRTRRLRIMDQGVDDLKPAAPNPEARFARAVFYLDRDASRAIRDFDLVADGDRLLVGLSGGKDSTMLLQILARRRAWRHGHYELQACHVRPPHQVACEETASPESGAETARHVERFLTAMCSRLDVPLHVVDSDPLPDQSEVTRPLSSCFLCARRRRKALVETAVGLGIRKVALGHHMNDVAETLLLNLLWQGRCEGMLPRRDMFAGRVTLIRPLIYIEERELARACRLGGFPSIRCSCAFADRSKREVAASILEMVRRAGARGAAANALGVALKQARNRAVP